MLRVEVERPPRLARHACVRMAVQRVVAAVVLQAALVVYVGGLDCKGKAKDTRTEKQKAALLALLVDLRKLYPEARISGHRDFSPDLNGNGIIEPKEWIKECPCFDAKLEYINV